jgi:hypothetical protein
MLELDHIDGFFAPRERIGATTVTVIVMALSQKDIDGFDEVFRQFLLTFMTMLVGTMDEKKFVTREMIQ